MEELSFEEAYRKLEETVQALESGGLTLEEATSLFEDGMRLARLCTQRLDKAELKITQLQASLADQMKLMEEEDEADN